MGEGGEGRGGKRNGKQKGRMVFTWPPINKPKKVIGSFGRVMKKRRQVIDGRKRNHSR